MARKYLRTNHVLATAGLCALLALPAVGVAADTEPATLEMLVIQSASTPAQHEALASHYREKAAEERAEVTKHQKMAKSYGDRKLGADTFMRSHCEALVKAAEESAKHYDALAQYHQAEAKNAAK